MGYPETRLCTSKWQVFYHMAIVGLCVEIVCMYGEQTVSKVSWMGYQDYVPASAKYAIT